MTLNTEEIQEVLTSLGYQLADKGAYWQTTALYRQGDNKTALLIYKDSGVWRDFVTQTAPMPFKALVEAHVGTNASDVVDKYLKTHTRGSFYKTPTVNKEDLKVKMEQVYDESALDKLLPHYKFYINKGISSGLLKNFKCGLATRGQMYQRFVFPIYNQHGQIHGFAGRDMTDNPNRPKWKHIGKKTKWVYPLYLHPEMADIISEKGVILVESIGDLLALNEHGYKNVLVTFGLDVSPALMCALISLSPTVITLAFNNDVNNKINRGLVGCCKNYLKLLTHFDQEKLKICLPIKNDFGDMSPDDFSSWDDKNKSIIPSTQGPKLKKYMDQFYKERLISKNVHQNIKFINTL